MRPASYALWRQLGSWGRRRGWGAWSAWSMAVLAGCGLDPVEPCTIAFALEPDPVPLYAEPTPCDPFVMPPLQPHIMPPVAVGRTASGETYVIDRLDHGHNRLGDSTTLPSRFFVAEGDTLVRHAGGAGLGQATTKWHYGGFGGVDGGVYGMMRVRRTPGVPDHLTPEDLRMVVFDEAPPFDVLPAERFSEGEPIEVLPECAVRDYAVEDPFRDREIEYVAADALGNQILVTRPVVDGSLEALKLFYGPPGEVRERAVASVGRKKDGGTTQIRFELDGRPATLHFYVRLGRPPWRAWSGELEVGGERTLKVTHPSRDPADLGGNRYLCHDQTLTEAQWAAL